MLVAEEDAPREGARGSGRKVLTSHLSFERKNARKPNPRRYPGAGYE